MKIENSQIEQTAKSFVDALMKETDEVKELVLPALRQLLVEVRDIRMTLDREVTNIINTMGTFRTVSKGTDDVVKFVKAIESLKETMANMDDRFKTKMQDFFHD